MTALLRLEGVVAGYGQAMVLRGVDLDVRAAAVTCLIGPNGAGKSTVLNTISGLLSPREGSITLNGRRRHDRAGSLSGGEQRIVELARALLLDPLLVLMDEPSIGLAPQASRQVFDGIVAMRQAG